MQIKVKKLNEKAIIPAYATDGAACFDLFAATVDGKHEFVRRLRYGGPLVVGTGLSFEIPEGFAMLVFSRSGHGFKHNARLANCVGVIDSDYRGEVMVKLTTDMPSDSKGAQLFVMPGNRIAQAMIIPVGRVSFDEVDELGQTERGDGGFGSTGK